MNATIEGMGRGVKLHNLARAIRVAWTLFSFALYVYLDSKGWFGKGEEKRETRLRRQAARLRARLVALGPTFIKMGQMLATRADLLPLEYVDELSALQDSVPAFADDQAFEIIESELNRSIKDVFAQIGERSIASASLGQVYRARLATGEDVAVKVQRPRLSGR
jgi:predicted unusual protein kinase regulating ubiquinone biosynthesis (AarF/ABC1/UbiB family)